MPDYADVEPDVLAAVAERCLALPDAYQEQAWTGRRFMVRRTNFCHILAIHDQHGVVRTIMNLRADEGEVEILVATGHPFFQGWGPGVLGFVIDDDTDWDEVGEVVTDSYCFVAPKKLAALVERPGD